MSQNFFESVREALSRLTEAVRERAAAEAQITTNFQEAITRAEREAERARRANALARAKELERIDQAHTENRASIARKYDSEQYLADRNRDERQNALTRVYTAAADRARSEHQDKLWHIDTLLEAGEKAARERFDSLRRRAAAGEEQVSTTWAEVELLLARVGVSRSDVESTADPGEPGDDDPISRLDKALHEATGARDRLGSLRLPAWSGPGGLAVLVGLLAALGASTWAFLAPATAVAVTLGTGVVLGPLLWLTARRLARRSTLRHGRTLGRHLAEASRAARLLNDFAAREYAEERARLSERHARKRQETDDYYRRLLELQRKMYEAELERVAGEHAAVSERLSRQRSGEEQAEDRSYEESRADVSRRLDEELAHIERVFSEKRQAATHDREAAWESMATAWHSASTAVAQTFSRLRTEGEEFFPDWDALARPDRPLPQRVPRGVRFGSWLVDRHPPIDGDRADPRLAWPEELSGPVPVFLPFPDRCSVLLRVRDEGRARAVATLQAMMLRFLTGLPPGKVRFTIIDPIGLGENFASFMHLADYDDKLVTSQIWTEPAHIEQRLADLRDHIASVIQKYLRNQYPTIEDYNRAAGEVAEPYRVLVIANFPTNFTPEAAKHLTSIATSGPSCGVCTLVSADTRLAMPRDFNLADLEAASFTLVWKDGEFRPKDPVLANFPLVLDTPPGIEAIGQIVRRIGRASRDTVRVEVPFEFIAPKPEEVWSGDASKGFDVPVGRAGATRRQVFRLGYGTAQHALVAGKTGSGKSTLLHALITNLALTYSPDEAELYLIDFKEGVEFQWYATYRLPHARVVAIQSEREFGLSVLQRLDAVLRERGEKFRAAGVNDLAGYRAARPEEKTPRVLLVIDEFQQLFVEDDKLAQESALLLDRLVRQGRAFGLHVLLGSQTLGGSYSLPRSTLDQMAVRVALQCSEADAQLILNKDNTAARLLSRPGEAIYNDQNGLVEGNNPFQVVWLSDEKREQLLGELRTRAGERWPPPIVFAGNTSADLTANRPLARLLNAPAVAPAPVAWLGDPVAIKEPTAVAFRPLGGNNLLVVGQAEATARALFGAALLALAAQVPAADRVFTLLDGTPDDAEEADYLRRLAARIPGADAPARPGLPAALAELATEVGRRTKGESPDRSPRFLLVFGLQRFRELRRSEDDFGFGRRNADREPTPAERFATILRDGPPVGVHALVWCDTLTNLNRAVDRPQLREFALRVLFQMSAADSSTLMDTPAASRLGRNRALLFVEESDRPEKFRPYGLPPAGWLDQVCDRLRERVGLNVAAAGV